MSKMSTRNKTSTKSKMSKKGQKEQEDQEDQGEHLGVCRPASSGGGWFRSCGPLLCMLCVCGFGRVNFFKDQI